MQDVVLRVLTQDSQGSIHIPIFTHSPEKKTAYSPRGENSAAHHRPAPNSQYVHLRRLQIHKQGKESIN